MVRAGHQPDSCRERTGLRDPGGRLMTATRRFRIECPHDADGFPPFVVDGQATNVVFADGDDELKCWLREAASLGAEVTWTEEEN